MTISNQQSSTGDRDSGIGKQHRSVTVQYYCTTVLDKLVPLTGTEQGNDFT